MSTSATPGIVGPFAGLDVPWLLRMRAATRGDHPFLIWAPFDGPARQWSYREFDDRVGALAAGLAKRDIKQGARGTLRSVYCRDPDGNLIEIASYPSTP